MDIRGTHIPYYRKQVLLHEGIFMDRKIVEVIRNIDMIKCEREYMIEQLESKVELVDIDGRNSFHYETHY